MFDSSRVFTGGYNMHTWMNVVCETSVSIDVINIQWFSLIGLLVVSLIGSLVVANKWWKKEYQL